MKASYFRSLWRGHCKKWHATISTIPPAFFVDRWFAARTQTSFTTYAGDLITRFWIILTDLLIVEQDVVRFLRSTILTLPVGSRQPIPSWSLAIEIWLYAAAPFLVTRSLRVTLSWCSRARLLCDYHLSAPMQTRGAIISDPPS